MKIEILNEENVNERDDYAQYSKFPPLCYTTLCDMQTWLK